MCCVLMCDNAFQHKILNERTLKGEKESEDVEIKKILSFVSTNETNLL